MNWRLTSWTGYPQALVGPFQPDVRPIAWLKYRLVSDYMVMLLGDGETFARLTLLAPFELDGASVPRLVWTLSGLRPDGLLRAGAVVHDYVYSKKGRVEVVINGVLTPVTVSRADADRIFLDLMLAAGMPSWRAKLAYRAVRAFGPRW